jgi:DNA-binding NarL/FixJ family response regulator
LYKHRFRGVAEVEIIGEFESAEDALVHIPTLNPHLVITDYTLPGMSGIELAEKLSEYPHIKVLVVTGHEPDHIRPQQENPPHYHILHKDWSKAVFDRILGFCA